MDLHSLLKEMIARAALDLHIVAGISLAFG